MITSPDNSQLKLIRKLARKRERDRSGLFVAEGDDLIAAAAAAGWEPEVLLWAGKDVEPELLDRVSQMGSGTRVIGVYRQRWAEPGGDLSIALHGVGDPGNVGTIIRSAHALADAPVVIGPETADPYGPKAVRAAMGSLFARPPARNKGSDPVRCTTVALDAGAPDLLAPIDGPVTLLVGAEREGLPADVVESADVRARIPLRPDGPESLNAAMAATLALYVMSSVRGSSDFRPDYAPPAMGSRSDG